MVIVLCNVCFLVGDEFCDDLVVVIEDGCIIVLLFDVVLQLGYVVKQVDLGGGWLLFGFIDVQVNGGGGVLFNNMLDVVVLCIIVQVYCCFGIIVMLFMLISDDVGVMCEVIGVMCEVIVQGVLGVIGIYLEGFYIVLVCKGMYDVSKFCVLDEEEIVLVVLLDNGVMLLMLVLECVLLEIICVLVECGVIVVVGYIVGIYEEICVGLDVGVCGFIYLYNVMLLL